MSTRDTDSGKVGQYTRDHLPPIRTESALRHERYLAWNFIHGISLGIGASELCYQNYPDPISATVEALQSSINGDFAPVDPERDTPERIPKFVDDFDPLGTEMTGTPEQIKVSTKSFNVYYVNEDQKGAPDGHTVDQTASLRPFHKTRLFQHNSPRNFRRSKG